MSDQGGVENVLEERPDLVEPLESVLAVDEVNDTWTFDDLSIGSGHFGELVSSGIVTKSDGEYTLTDPEAVRAALSDGEMETASRSEWTPTVSLPSLGNIGVDRTTVTLVIGAVLFVGAVRSHTLSRIYRNGDVVLSGNDPYYYRYWVDQVIGEAGSPMDVGALSTLPDPVRTGEPLYVTTMWLLSELLAPLGFSPGDVLAWYPVASAVVSAVILYLLAVRVTKDRRVGLASVLLFALLPGHAMRTSLGYADHHAFDYPWLAATALLLVFLATVHRDDLHRRRTWLLSIGLGVVVTGQTMAWNAAPILIAPVGLIVFSRTVIDVYNDRSPWVGAAPIAGGLTVGSVLSTLGHLYVGWQTPIVAFSPALLLVGTVGLSVVGTAISRTTGDLRHVLALDGVAFVLVLGVFRFVLPGAWERLASRIAFLFGGGGIAETFGLFSPGSFGFLFLFGFILLLALPAMAIGIGRASEEMAWLVATIYAWYFFALATIQIRFVGEFAVFAACFGGIGFVKTASWIDIVPSMADRTKSLLRVPDRRTMSALFFLFLLFGGFGALQVSVKTSQLTIHDDAFESAAYIAEYSDDLGQDYPDNYVLSRWGRNRMHNYFVNGDAESYVYAERTYDEFLLSRDPDAFYDQIQNRVGYAVVARISGDIPPETTAVRLADHFGSRNGETTGVGHYRVIYQPPGETRVVVALVPGANVTGTAPADATVTASTQVSVPGAGFTYERQTAAGSDGQYTLHLAQPGTYEVTVGNQTTSVTVPESAVRQGDNVTVG